MPAGISLHVGLNRVDDGKYEDDAGNPWGGELIACEFDATDMYQIAADRGFSARTLLTGAATSEAVLTAVEDAARRLEPGDMFFVTYAGHGGQIPDDDGDETSPFDQTWLLFDRQLIDDELYARWGLFRPGVRIFVLSDSCHSGTVTRFQPPELVAPDPADTRRMPQTPVKNRGMPAEVQTRDFALRGPDYTRIRQALRPSRIRASVLLISACQDSEEAGDGERNGRFTEEFLRVWDGGRFTGSYFDLYLDIRSGMPPRQQPNYFVFGENSKPFEEQPPLTI